MATETPTAAISSPIAYTQRLDAITARARPDLASSETSVDGAFQRFIQHCSPGFRPTVRMDLMGHEDGTFFAEAFDAAMHAMGRWERAHTAF